MQDYEPLDISRSCNAGPEILGNSTADAETGLKSFRGLVLTPGSLIPTFDLYGTEYTIAVGRSQVTVAPSNDHNASILLVDENAKVVEDVDEGLEGHQVEFNADLPTIKIRVVSEDSLASHTYTISDLGIRYDANENGVIDRGEVIAAIVDYFDERITRDETIAVIELYFST